MTDVFLPDLSFDQLTRDLRRNRATFVPQAISSEMLKLLTAEINGLVFNLEQRNDAALTLSYEAVTLHYPMPEYPWLGTLGELLAWKLRLHRGQLTNLANWHPNEVTVQRYQGPGDGIGPHRDFRRDRYLVGVFTVTGYGRFEVMADEFLPRGAAYDTGPGSLALLAAPDLFELGQDCRPRHQALPPIGATPRVSVAYRMSVRPS